MKVAVIGMGLIGGSLYKAALEAGYSCRGFDRQDTPELGDCDVVLLALPQEVLPGWAAEYGKSIRPGTIVVDTCGMKAAICKELGRLLPKECIFVGGHPMAGKEVSGWANASADLFRNASMILTPYPYMGRAPLDALERFFTSLGFARVVFTSPERHDEMIAYTSQLCHIISSAYLREPLSREHSGFSAGSFRDMVRVGAPDPQVWTELFLSNRDNLSDVLGRYIKRLEDFKAAIDSADTAALKAQLAEGKAAKEAIL